jgi:SAM-dependent methyltransferase
MDEPHDPALAARLFDLINAAWTTRALAVAAELRLAETLREGPQEAASIAQAAGCDADALRRLLRALCSIGICDERDDGRFSITPLGALLAEDAPQSLRSWTLQFGRQLWPAWGGLDESVRTGKGLRERSGHAHGFAHLQRDADAAAVFNRAMVEITRIVAADAMRKVDLTGLRRFVDVGGGHGQLLAAFLHRWPQASGVSVDLSHAQAGALLHFEAERLGERAGFVVGDFFSEVPTADVLLLKAILHDWNDERCALILRNCRRALGTGGRLLVMDRVLPERLIDEPRHRSLARSDLTMLVGVGGRERTEAQFRKLFHDSHFTIDSLQPLVLGLSLLDCRAA